MDASAFYVLQQKEIYEFLEGSGDNQLITFNGQSYGMPYLSERDLDNICRDFGVTDPLGGSRWTYVKALLQYAIANNRCDELLSYLFELDKFKNLKDIQEMETIEELHAKIVDAAVQKINQIIRLSRKELVHTNGHFYITDVGTRPIIQTPKVEALTTAYIRGLCERCEADLVAGNYDSVVTKSRTLIEEVLIQILEEAGVTPTTSGKIRELYNQVKTLRGMQQSSTFDNRINGLLSGLEKIVQNISDMRNINSDAHGVGSNRVGIREKEARLIINSAITFCEYLL